MLGSTAESSSESGKESSYASTLTATASCTDTDNGAASAEGKTCNHFPNGVGCGIDDDFDFSSEEMCCVCGGGRRGPMKADFHCEEGQGQADSLSLYATSSTNENNEASCFARCSSENFCVGFDFTTSEQPDACRTYTANTPRSSGGQSGRQYCAMRGESACEGRGYDAAECLKVGCCEYEGGQCWSKVASELCAEIVVTNSKAMHN